ncbi:MAG: hypothetical protein Kow0089_17500 [Desulfobulbaceae bacterium]
MGRKPDVEDIENLYQGALALHARGEHRQAVHLYCRVLDHHRGSAEIFYNLGLAWFELGCYPEAIEACRRAAALDPEDGDIFFNLGLACKMNAQYDEAEEAYLTALSLSDDRTDILYNLGCCYQDAGHVDQACLVYDHLLELVPDHLPALNNLAYLLHLREEYDAARELYARILALDPDRQSAQHMFATLSGETTKAPPPEYVRELFDRYSDRFEESLVNELEYHTYCILRQAVEGVTESRRRFNHALDLGCGTGLAGEAFRPLCSRMTGVDLSENMLARAAEKNLYNELHCAEIIDFLQCTNTEYDLIVAADVLPYLGDLAPLFRAAAEQAAPGALFCLSSEGCDIHPWELRVTGRYAHHPDYLAGTALRNDWLVLERFTANIRRENNAWINGTIFVFGRNETNRA